MIVELGPGTRPHPLTDVGIDLHHPTPGWRGDVTETPWRDMTADSVDVVYSSHLLEHVPKDGGALIRVMNEAWRVLKPGGAFIAIMPLVGFTDPFTGQALSDHIGWQPWADPTHVTFWWLPEAFQYFCDGPLKPDADYGIRLWAPLGAFIEPSDVDVHLADIRRSGPSFWTVRDGWEGVAKLVKP